MKKGGGHGFSFMISPMKELPGASSSHYLGLFNSSNDGDPRNHVFAVEFDTVNGLGAFGDISSNHVGIDINGLTSNISADASYYIGENGNSKEDVDLESGKPIRVWVDYDGVHEIVNVTVAPLHMPRPTRPLLSNKYDLSAVLKDQMFVGFSASTAKLSSSHYILGWSFRLNGTAQDFTVSSLPTPPSVVTPSNTIKIVNIVVPVVSVMLFITVVALLCMYRSRWRRLAETLEDWELDCPHRFRYKDLHLATKGFKQSEVIGIGGFGEVYKGVLPTTGEQVAVKKINQNSLSGIRQFVAEIESLGRLRHKNLVHLLGWCKRKKSLLLVYDFVPNGSLDIALDLGRKSRVHVLSWEQRFKILKDIASALLYLHEDWEQVVIHRDVKASNVLLDADMNGRLGDFGLARLYDHGDNPRTTQVVGTLGYLAPELARTGKATTSSDVFAYGTLLLVVACGRGAINPNVEDSTLMDWVSDCYQSGQILDAMDKNLNLSYDVEEAELVLKLGLICTHNKPELRPSMRQISRYLNGDDLLYCSNLATDVHYPCVNNNIKAKLAKINASKNSVSCPSSSSFGPISCESFEAGR
ncbi:hypothetical protein Sjap_014195 [Stephania japonica]|uniref:non-specific serine/threonine protein kinase n=1 Tax=Stephania japonica TaxID=461633 RepID=A0AAP0J170_9MAGN